MNDGRSSGAGAHTSGSGSQAESTYLEVLGKHWLTVLLTVALFAVTAALVSTTLKKVYATSSLLLVAQPAETGTFDAVQAAQVAARTYSDLLGSPNVARLVAARIGGGATTSDVRGAVSIEPVAETQLIRITARAPVPQRAKAIADAYGDVFIARTRGSLAGTTQASVTLADPAPLPSYPVRPKPAVYTLVAAILGLGVGLALAFARERLDTRLRTVEEVESSFDLPILTRVPRRGKADVSISAFTEAFRLLRTNLAFASGDGPPRTLAIASAAENEGKTTTVSQLTLVTAATGTNVLAVEADTRRPMLQRVFAPGEGEPLRPGLTNYFLGGAPLEAIIHPTSVPTVEFVPSGPVVPSLAGLLESQRGRTAIDDLAASADMVIFDCPPLALGADAATVAGRVDGVLLVVDLESATVKSVRYALRQLEAVRANVLGFVLNRDRTMEPLVYGYLGDSPPARGSRVLSRG